MTWTKSQKAYARSQNGKLARKRYQDSVKGKAARERYMAKRKVRLTAVKQVKTQFTAEPITKQEPIKEVIKSK